MTFKETNGGNWLGRVVDNKYEERGMRITHSLYLAQFCVCVCEKERKRQLIASFTIVGSGNWQVCEVTKNVPSSSPLLIFSLLLLSFSLWLSLGSFSHPSSVIFLHSSIFASLPSLRFFLWCINIWTFQTHYVLHKQNRNVTHRFCGEREWCRVSTCTDRAIALDVSTEFTPPSLLLTLRPLTFTLCNVGWTIYIRTSVTHTMEGNCNGWSTETREKPCTPFHSVCTNIPIAKTASIYAYSNVNSTKLQPFSPTPNSTSNQLYQLVTYTQPKIYQNRLYSNFVSSRVSVLDFSLNFSSLDICSAIQSKLHQFTHLGTYCTCN